MESPYRYWHPAPTHHELGAHGLGYTSDFAPLAAVGVWRTTPPIEYAPNKFLTGTTIEELTTWEAGGEQEPADYNQP
jgi:hypothetical protein